MKHFLARLAAGILLALAVMTAVAAPAHAADGYVVSGIALAFTLDPATIVQLLVAFVLPVLVGLVTNSNTDPARKSWLLAGLNLVASILVELGRAIVDAATFDVGVALLAALPAFVVSVAAHYGLWKPTRVSATVQAIGSKSEEV